MSSKENKQIQCHFMSNTHWDREWQTSFQRTRHMLCYMMDMVVDILEKEPRYKHFVLDSQTIPVQDYLEIRPEREALLRKLVQEKRLIIGPWYTLPDQYGVGGESLIRNLLLGHKIAKDFGHCPKTGYSPFGWGHTSQMPQIYQGFGIGFMAFYRGLNSQVAPKSEFIWEAPDGTRLVGSRLGKRLRYNAWYLLHRAALYNTPDINDRKTLWSNGNAPFRFVTEQKADWFYRYAHLKYGYYKDRIKDAAEQAIAEQDPDYRTNHRFWANGHDLSCPDIREAQVIEDANEALGDAAHVFHSTFEDFQNGVIENLNMDDVNVVTGEMRNYMMRGDYFGYMGSLVGSTRTWLKQHNFMAERALQRYAEPLAVFAGMLGAEFPRGFVDLAMQTLLENHGHDSIGGCHRDVISDDIHNRLIQVEGISDSVMEKALIDIAGSIDFHDRDPSDVAIVVYNPASFEREEVMRTVIEIPQELKHDAIQIVDQDGNVLPAQMIAKKSPAYNNIYIPSDCQLALTSTRYTMDIQFPGIPAFGYRTFFVKPVVRPKLENPKTMLTGPQTMENEHVQVKINSNGTYDVKDKASGHVYEGLGYFRDSSEVGTPHEHFTVQNEQLLTTLNENAEVALIRDGELETSFRVTLRWMLPDGITADKKERNPHKKEYVIISTLTLRKGQRWLDVKTELDNNIEYHYLQLSFPSNLKTDVVNVQGHYDVFSRPIPKPDFSVHDEAPEPEQPMDSFLDLSDGNIGLAILNEGLKAYEAHDDPQRTVSLSLLRCFSLALGWTYAIEFGEYEKGTQNPGKHTFHYAVMPHAGDWKTGDVWQASEQFNLALQAGQIGPSEHGTEPLSKSFLEIDPENLVVSAVKQSESGEGWVVRLFNPDDETVKAKIRMNGGRANSEKVPSPVELVEAEGTLPGPSSNAWKQVREVTMEELPKADLTMDADGWVEFDITKKKIMTIEFLP